jgi:hypothetical protein
MGLSYGVGLGDGSCLPRLLLYFWALMMLNFYLGLNRKYKVSIH